MRWSVYQCKYRTKYDFYTEGSGLEDVLILLPDETDEGKEIKRTNDTKLVYKLYCSKNEIKTLKS